MEPIFERRRLLPTPVDVLVEADDSGPPDVEGRRLFGPRAFGVLPDIESSDEDIET